MGVKREIEVNIIPHIEGSKSTNDVGCTEVSTYTVYEDTVKINENGKNTKISFSGSYEFSGYIGESKYNFDASITISTKEFNEAIDEYLINGYNDKIEVDRDSLDIEYHYKESSKDFNSLAEYVNYFKCHDYDVQGACSCLEYYGSEEVTNKVFREYCEYAHVDLDRVEKELNMEDIFSYSDGLERCKITTDSDDFSDEFIEFDARTGDRILNMFKTAIDEPFDVGEAMSNIFIELV